MAKDEEEQEDQDIPDLRPPLLGSGSKFFALCVLACLVIVVVGFFVYACGMSRLR